MAASVVCLSGSDAGGPAWLPGVADAPLCDWAEHGVERADTEARCTLLADSVAPVLPIGSPSPDDCLRCSLWFDLEKMQI